MEYGGPLRNSYLVDSAAGAFADMITTLEGFDFTRHIGNATVEMVPAGVAGHRDGARRCRRDRDHPSP